MSLESLKDLFVKPDKTVVEEVPVKVNTRFNDQLERVKAISNRLAALANGRLESDIPHNESYWTAKDELTLANHKLDNLR